MNTLKETAPAEPELKDHVQSPDSKPAENEYTIYGDKLPRMQAALDGVLEAVSEYRKIRKAVHGDDPVEHCLSRIKTDASMRDKCTRRGLPFTQETALTEIKDAIGVRVVCQFLKEIYGIRDYLADVSGYTVVREKDYLKKAKRNGYRSYHMTLLADGFFVEVQLRTISMDTWAALEHQMRYKNRSGRAEDSLIISELKRCADELASTDISMQTIRDMIFEEGAFSKPSG